MSTLNTTITFSENDRFLFFALRFAILLLLLLDSTEKSEPKYSTIHQMTVKSLLRMPDQPAGTLATKRRYFAYSSKDAACHFIHLSRLTTGLACDYNEVNKLFLCSEVNGQCSSP
jgi:hypothetical protein